MTRTAEVDTGENGVRGASSVERHRAGFVAALAAERLLGQALGYAPDQPRTVPQLDVLRSYATPAFMAAVRAEKYAARGGQQTGLRQRVLRLLMRLFLRRTIAKMRRQLRLPPEGLAPEQYAQAVSEVHVMLLPLAYALEARWDQLRDPESGDQRTVEMEILGAEAARESLTITGGDLLLAIRLLALAGLAALD